VIQLNGWEIENSGRSTYYWTREDHEGEAVIDMTLATRLIMKWTILADNHATGSDHEVIEWKLEVNGKEEAYHEKVGV